MRHRRSDRQYFKELDTVELKAVVEGLDLVRDRRMMNDNLSVLEVRPVYLLLEKARNELKRRSVKIHEGENGSEVTSDSMDFL